MKKIYEEGESRREGMTERRGMAEIAS